MKRVLLFLGTNIAVILVLSVVLSLLGVDRILDEQGVGLNLQHLLIFAAVFGFGGAFICDFLIPSGWPFCRPGDLEERGRAWDRFFCDHHSGPDSVWNPGQRGRALVQSAKGIPG